MNDMQDWHTLLEQAGARREGDRVVDYGDAAGEAAAAAEGDVLADLGHYGLLRVGGADSMQFLQNQLTNDVRQVDAAHSQLSAYCSPKGRVLASFRLFKRGDDYCLRLPAELSETLRTRLAKYVMMSKVTIEDASAEWVRFGISGPRAATLLDARLGAVPAADNESATADEVTVIRVPGPHPRFEVVAPPARAAELWRELSAEAKPVGADAWRLLEVRAGLPTVYEPTVEAFVPQMLNLQLVEGVSFRKGCYPGQEVVARMQYLGQLKRRMYLGHVQADARPQPGDALHSPDSDSGQGAGKVVEAAPSPGGGFDVLAVMQISVADTGNISLGGPDGPAVSLRELPYGWDQGDAPRAD